MARADNVNRVKQLLYGTGLYEKPPLRVLDASGNDSLGSAVTVTLTSADASKVAKGDVLSTTTGVAASSYAFYVTDADSTTITAIPQYLGSPDPSAADLNSAVLEQNPKVTEHEIHTAIDTIVNSYLWPELFGIASSTLSPDLATGQVEVPATVKRLIGAWQIQSGVATPIKYSLHRNLPTGISSTTVLFEGGFLDGTTTYYSFMRKLVEADTEDWLEDMIAYGATAILIDSSVPNVAVPYRPSTSDGQVALSVGEAMWRSFLQLREQARLDLSRDFEYFETRH